MAYIAISPNQSSAGIAARPEYIEEVASSVWKAGAPLVKDANGFMAEAGAAPALIYGYAISDGQNLASSGLKKAGCYRARSDVPMDINWLGTIAQTNKDEAFGLVKGGDGIWYGDPGAATKQLILVNWSSRVKIGDVNPIVEMITKTANIQSV